MRRKILAITAAVALGAAMTTGAMAAHVGSGGGGFGAAGGARSMGAMTGGVGSHTWSGTAGRTWNGPNAHAYTNNAMGPRTYTNDAMGPHTNGAWNGNMGHHHHHHHFAGNFPGLFLYDTGPDYYDYCAYPYYYSDPSCYYGYDY